MVNKLNSNSYIVSLRGEIIDIGFDYAVIECAGVGYCTYITASAAAQLRRGEQGFIHTTMVVREDSMTLYGFANTSERELFSQLQTVSGVGPRLALAAITALGSQQIYTAIASSDTITLSKVSGIGKRVAERLIMELKDKLAPYSDTNSIVLEKIDPIPNGHDNHNDIVEALVGLGFSYKEATTAINESISDQPDSSAEILIKRALATLGSRR